MKISQNISGEKKKPNYELFETFKVVTLARQPSSTLHQLGISSTSTGEARKLNLLNISYSSFFSLTFLPFLFSTPPPPHLSRSLHLFLSRVFSRELAFHGHNTHKRYHSGILQPKTSRATLRGGPHLPLSPPWKKFHSKPQTVFVQVSYAFRELSASKRGELQASQRVQRCEQDAPQDAVGLRRHCADGAIKSSRV